MLTIATLDNTGTDGYGRRLSSAVSSHHSLPWVTVPRRMTNLEKKALQEALRIIEGIEPWKILREAEGRLKDELKAIAPSLPQATQDKLAASVNSAKGEAVNNFYKEVSSAKTWLSAVLNEKQA